MSASYSDPSCTPKDALRFLIGDTGPTNFQFTDAELLYLLDTHSNVYMAAATACDMMTTLVTSGGLASKSVGELSESYSQGSVQFWTSKSAMFRKMGSGKAVPISAASTGRGLCAPQIFGIGQFDRRGTTQPVPPGAWDVTWNVYDSEEKM